MTSNSNKLEEEFIEAKNNWNLEKLYVDLASAKGKALTPVEKKFLRGLLCGCSPAEIANAVYKSRSSSTVRVYLSNGLYKYMEQMLSNQTGNSVKINSWNRVTQLLEKAGYKKDLSPQLQESNQLTATEFEETNIVTINSQKRQDWGEAIDVGLFYGRTTELAQLEKWVVTEHCRLLVLLGMGGIGKTALSVKLAEQIQNKFDYVIWRSLTLAPPLEVILNQLIQFLSPQPLPIAETVESRISQLIECLRSSRCLIVLDNFDSILDSADAQTSNLDILNYSNYTLSHIRYLKGYEGYGELIKRVGSSRHQSCLLLTSREKPKEIAALEGETLPVRSSKLTGLSHIESWKILKAKGFADFSERKGKVLNQQYAGNPLFIKIAATTIQELFEGNIKEFLEHGTVVFGDIRDILDQQFYRLSYLEKQIMYWLTLNQDLVSLQQMQKDILPRVSQRIILEAIELLQRRSLIYRQGMSFSQNQVLKEYIAEILIEENFKLTEARKGSLMSDTLFELKLKNYIRETRVNAEI